MFYPYFVLILVTLVKSFGKVALIVNFESLCEIVLQSFVCIHLNVYFYIVRAISSCGDSISLKLDAMGSFLCGQSLLRTCIIDSLHPF